MEKRKYKDMTIDELSTTKTVVEGTASFRDKRIVFKGRFTIDRTKCSWKFGNQIQFVLWCREPIKIEQRAQNDGYNRIEIAMSEKMGYNILSEAISNLNAPLEKPKIKPTSLADWMGGG